MILSNLLPEGGVKVLKDEIVSIVENARFDWLAKNSARTAEGEFVVIHSIDTPSDLIFRCGRDPVLVRLAESFARKRVTPLYAEYFNKPPRYGLPSPVHQDHAFYNEHFPDELGVSFWIALEDCDVANGCMHVRPTKDHLLLPHQESKVFGFAYEMKDPRLEGFVAVPLKSGDALLLSSFTPHYTPRNRSDRSRMAIVISFRTSDYREEISPWIP